MSQDGLHQQQASREWCPENRVNSDRRFVGHPHRIVRSVNLGASPDEILNNLGLPLEMIVVSGPGTNHTRSGMNLAKDIGQEPLVQRHAEERILQR